MYKLFSQMSDRLLRDINDDETLLNLAKILSSFNLSKNAKSDADSKSAKLGEKTNKRETLNSDFVFSEPNEKQTNLKFGYNVKNGKLPKMSKTHPAPFPTQSKKSTNNEWEFEWMGKDQNQSKKSEASKMKSTLPSFVRTDSEDELDDDFENDSNYEEVFSFNDKFKMNQIFSNR